MAAFLMSVFIEGLIHVQYPGIENQVTKRCVSNRRVLLNDKLLKGTQTVECSMSAYLRRHGKIPGFGGSSQTTSAFGRLAIFLPSKTEDAAIH